MFANIIIKTLDCTAVRAAVASIINTKSANTILMRAVENAVREYGINCYTQRTNNGMEFVVGSTESVELSIKVADAAKMEIVSKALETIKDNGLNKEELQKELLQVVLGQLKNH